MAVNCLLWFPGCEVVWSCRWLPDFRRKISNEDVFLSEFVQFVSGFWALSW
jgi:hypothetical protein